jgi:hypothetical protein
MINVTKSVALAQNLSADGTDLGGRTDQEGAAYKGRMSLILSAPRNIILASVRLVN